MTSNGATTPTENPGSDQIPRVMIQISETGSFTFPSAKQTISTSDFYERVASNHVVVTGIFGKTRVRDQIFEKGFLFDDLLQRDVFRIADEETDPDLNEPLIYGYHDERSNRIFLHLFAPSFDVRALSREVDKYKQDSEEDFRTLMSSREFRDTKLLLFMFHVCHVMILYNPGHTIDLSYLALFQALDSIRLKFHDILGDFLQSLNLGLTKDWLNHGRITQPRLIFYFASCPIDLRGSKGTSDLVKRDGTISKHPPIRKIEFSLEDQIYRIFRRAKIVSNSSNNCLFCLPTREGYVYVNNGTADGDFGDKTFNRLNHLLKTFENGHEQTETSGPFVPYFYQQSILESRTGSRCFETFLTSHIEAIFSKNNSGSNSESSRSSVEVPTAAQWYDGSSNLFGIFGSQPDSFSSYEWSFELDPDVLRKGTSTLKAYTEIETRFSDFRCSKALPIALATYKEGLQPYYLEEYHNAKLMQAMALFYVHARGPASARYAEMLASECMSYWQSGRQMCEELSLTGHHCTNRKHQTSEDQARKDEESNLGSESVGKKILPTMAHSSEVVFLSACNCGRKQADREDPFSLIDANRNFYTELQEDCCTALEHIEVPVYQAQSSDFVMTANLNKEEEATASEDPTKGQLQNLASLASKPKDSPKNRTECIQTMLTKTSKPGVLPAFPSWAMTQLGSSHLYAHSSGVNQPGFMSGMKSLHSWDVPLKNVEWSVLQDKWPNLADYAIKKPNFNKNAKGLDMGLTVKVFVGLEYECARGHRFISASPEKTVRTKSASSTATKIVSSDLPLYMPCPCRATSSSRPLVAQMMRLHLVTPKAPVHVTLAPCVVPCPDGPVFHPGWSEPIKVPINSYWVLRFPYIYWGESGSHIPPKDVPPLSYGRLLKGFIGITEDYEYK